jgi:ribosomal protein S28E/S33
VSPEHDSALTKHVPIGDANAIFLGRTIGVGAVVAVDIEVRREGQRGRIIRRIVRVEVEIPLKSFKILTGTRLQSHPL